MQNPPANRLTVLAILATAMTGAAVFLQFFQVFSPSTRNPNPPAAVSEPHVGDESLFRPKTAASKPAPDVPAFSAKTVFGNGPQKERLRLDADGMRTAPFAERLAKELSLIEDQFPGSISLYLADEKRGYAFGHFEDRLMYLASGVKLLVMIEAYRQRETGQLRFDEKIFYGPKDLRDGAPDLNRRRVNQYFTVEELLTFMIANSDNAAADLLMRRLGPDNIRLNLIEAGFDNVPPIVPLVHVRHAVYESLDPRAKRLSAKQVRSIRWSNGFQPNLGRMKRHIGRPYGTYDYRHLDEAYRRYYQRGKNHLTMRTAGHILRRLVAGELVSPKASEEMIARLVQVWSSGHRIRGALDRSIPVAHKTGTQHKRLVDLSIVTLPDDTPVILTLAVAGGRRQDAERIMFAVTQRVYGYVWRHAQNLTQPPKMKEGLMANVLLECKSPQPEGYQGPQVNP